MTSRFPCEPGHCRGDFCIDYGSCLIDEPCSFCNGRCEVSEEKHKEWEKIRASQPEG